jgi:very-short-patch-repair endonuclease
MRHRPPIATDQAGVFTRAQAREAGWSDRQIRHRLRSGIWLPHLGRGLVETGTRETAASIAWAAHLTVPDGVVSHRTAGFLAGFPLPGGLRPAHLLAGRHHRMPDLVIHRMPPPQDQRVRLDGLPVTAPPRTALDCLADLSPDEALRLWAWLRSRSVLDVSTLAAAVKEDRFGWPGTPVLLGLLRTVRDGAASIAERRLHRLLRRAGITGWVAGAKILDRCGRIVAEADVLFERERVVIEVDGFAAHSSRDAFVSDRRRLRLLAELGYHVVQVTWDDLVQLPDELLAQIRAALERRGRPPSIIIGRVPETDLGGRFPGRAR